jgi:hypothetical protein
MKYENVLIPCKFNVLFFEMGTISNHNQIFTFFCFLKNNMPQLFLTHPINYTPFICGKGVTEKERVRKHSTLTTFNEPRRPCSPKILTHNSDLQSHTAH